MLQADYCLWFFGHTTIPLHFVIKLTHGGNRVLQKKLNFTGSRYHNAPQLQNPVDMGRTVCLEARGKHQSITSHQVE